MLGRLTGRNFASRGRIALAIAVLDTGADFATARRAAEWVRQFYPDIAVTVDRTTVRLGSDTRSEGELCLIWRSNFANEALHARGADRHAGVIGDLIA